VKETAAWDGSRMSTTLAQISKLELWKTEVDIKPVDGGITNQNFIVSDRGQKYFVRVGVDIPEHGIKRFNELAASRAAHTAGLSPEVIYSEPGIMVLDFIEAAALTAADIRHPDLLPEIIKLVQRCHRDIPRVYRGPALIFWVFQVLRDYFQTLKEGQSSWVNQLAGLMKIANRLEQDVGEIELVFGHNDLLSANFLNDGHRLWLIDWDYAGFNSPLFDLGGLASNNQFLPEQENLLLESYYGSAPSRTLLKKYSAMKCASLLREVMWSMVSEIHSDIDFDYAAYTRNNLSMFEKAWEVHRQQ
jgi:thiamine kinase-like enzyme